MNMVRMKFSISIAIVGMIVMGTISLNISPSLILLSSSSSFRIISQASAFVIPPPLSSRSQRVIGPTSSSLSELFAFTPSHSINPELIRFLGKGPNALVRPGVVLVSPKEVYDHYLMQAAVFVYAMGLEEETNEEVIRCVVLDNPTPFTMNEMANGAVKGELGDNLLYRGGNAGGDSAMMLHNVTDLLKEEIGTSGIYEGGLDVAMEGKFDVDRFKFFFNYCEFRPQELSTMLDEMDSKGDGWISVEVPSEVILHEWDKNACWRYLRKIVKSRFKTIDEEEDEQQQQQQQQSPSSPSNPDFGGSGI